MNANEIVICGLPAVKARFARDARSIRRLFFDYETGRRIGAMCKALAAARKVYRCVEPAELEKIAGTLHHGGIVAVVDAPQMKEPSDDDLRRWATARAPLLVLDRIGNAHNLGAIARTAAFFGLTRLVLSSDSGSARPGEAAFRVAEGGLESLELWQAADVAALLKRLAAAGYEVAGAATRGGRAGIEPTKSPIALVLGNEETGLAPEVAAACTRLVTVQGSGKVESLNVSVAAAVLISRIWGR